MSDPNRRAVLKTSGALLSVGTLTSLAGCAGSVPGLGSGGPSIEDWVYEPGEVGDDRHLYLTASRPSDVAENAVEFDNEFYDNVSGDELLAATGVDYDDVSATVSILPAVDSLSDLFRAFFQGPTRVAAADYATEDVETELAGNGYSSVRTVDPYELYENEGGDRTVAVGSGHLVTASNGFDVGSETKVETVIEAAAGDEDRYVDESEDFSLALDRLGSGEFRTATTFDPETETDTQAGSFTGRVGRGVKLNVGGQMTTLQYVSVFESSDDIDVPEIEAWVDYSGDNDGYWSDVVDTSTEKNGRTAVTTGEIETDRIAVGTLLM